MSEYQGYYNRAVFLIVHYTNQESEIYGRKIDIYKKYKNKSISKSKFMSGINQAGRSAYMFYKKSEEEYDPSNKIPKLTGREIREIRKELVAEYNSNDWN